MKITVYYEDKTRPVTLEVPDADCEIWVETDYQQRLAAAADKSTVARRSPQEIMDEECNKPTFNNHQRETRRHCSLEQVDLDEGYLSGAEDIQTDLFDEDYKDLFLAIAKLRPQQQELLRKVFWENIRQIDIAKAEGTTKASISWRMARIYSRMKKLLSK